LAALLLVLAACNINGGGSSPNFTISLNPASLGIQQGGRSTTTLTITPQNGFTGTVNLSLVGAPSGVTLSPTSVSVTGSGPVTRNLTVVVGGSVATGSYSLQVRATSGSLTKTAGLSLTVTASGGGGGGGGGGTGSTPVYATRPDGVYRDGVRIPLYGVNWFGLETCDRAPHGLWSGRSVADFLAQVKGWGFTALRVPVSPQVLRDEGTGRTGLR
jgi:hypothetical protein